MSWSLSCALLKKGTTILVRQKSHPSCSLLTELVLGKLPSPTDEFCLAKDKLLSLASTVVTDNRDLVLANEQ